MYYLFYDGFKRTTIQRLQLYDVFKRQNIYLTQNLTLNNAHTMMNRKHRTTSISFKIFILHILCVSEIEQFLILSNQNILYRNKDFEEYMNTKFKASQKDSSKRD